MRSACSLVGVLAKVAISQPPVSPVQGAIENSDKYGPLTAEEVICADTNTNIASFSFSLLESQFLSATS